MATAGGVHYLCAIEHYVGMHVYRAKNMSWLETVERGREPGMAVEKTSVIHVTGESDVEKMRQSVWRLAVEIGLPMVNLIKVDTAESELG